MCNLPSIILFLILGTGVSIAQLSSRSPREIVAVGVSAGYSVEDLTSNFAVGASGQLVSGISCGKFESGSATQMLAGLHVSRPIRRDMRMGLDLELSSRGGSLRFPCIDPAMVRMPDGALADAVTEHVADISSTSIRLFPALQYFLGIGNLRLHVDLGPSLSIVVNGSYDVHEDVVTPASAEFLSGGQVRMYGGGEIDLLSRPLVPGVHAGVGLDLPASRFVDITPAIRGTLWFGNEIKELGIGSSSLAAFIRVSYRLDRQRQIAILPSDGRGPGNALISLHGGGLSDDGTLSDTLYGFRIQRLSTHLHPLLTYLFFERGESVLPSRYTHRPDRAQRNFREQELKGLTTLDVYHNLLDIIGSRMRSNPAAPLTIVASGPDVRSDLEGLELARARAAVVRGYLTNVWAIDSTRLRIDVRRNPMSPSSEETEDGAAENRRVELLSTDYAITAPIVFNDTLNAIKWERLAADVAIESPIELSTWSVQAGDATLATGEEDLSVRRRLERPGGDVIDSESGSVAVVMRYETVNGDEGTATTYVPISVQSVDSGLTFGTGSYSLILFDVRSSALRPEHTRTLSLVNGGTDPHASARVEGFTDRLGPDDLNQRLSSDRARSVANGLAMRVEEVAGRGESTELYDNDLPEGRFYSRSVTIVTSLQGD